MSFSTGPGLTYVVGENGSGKTTLLRLILGQLKGSGDIIVDGNGDTGRKLGYLPQRFAVPAALTAREFVEYIAWVKGLDREAVRTVAQVSLESVNLSERADDRLAALSGGMIRRVGIAQALATGANLLLLDEPTVGLDPLQRAELRGVLRRIGESRTLLVSTNLMADIDETDTILVLADGQAAFCGQAQEMRKEFGSPGMTLEDVFVAMYRRKFL
ncbi:MAG: ATP-binding cassette domain-containing protein [Acidimicrobiales bacterium]|nr:ATP-binding cassette domain-containing protein [Acidimicrobiales bacterium]